MNNLLGKTFGYLTVIKENNRCTKGSTWLCRCVCDKELILPESNLIGNKTRKPNKSCGCMRNSQNGLAWKYPRIYGTWNQLNRRCYNPKADNYDRYGGKGITVCEEWRNSFQSFLDWALNNGYSEKLTIDRIESDKPYEPSNCRWSDYFMQEQNRGLFRNNTTGHKNITYSKHGFRVGVMRFGKRICTKYYQTIDEAISVREKLKSELMLVAH